MGRASRATSALDWCERCRAAPCAPKKATTGVRPDMVQTMRKVMRAAAVVLLIASIAAASPASAADDDTKSYSLKLSGTLSGDGWEVSSKAKLVTSPEYKETYVEVTASPVDANSNRTPMLALTLGKSNLECSTFRSWVWTSMDNGSQMKLTLMCDKYVSPKKAKKMKAAILS